MAECKEWQCPLAMTMSQDSNRSSKRVTRSSTPPVFDGPLRLVSRTPELLFGGHARIRLLVSGATEQLSRKLRLKQGHRCRDSSCRFRMIRDLNRPPVALAVIIVA